MPDNSLLADGGERNQATLDLLILKTLAAKPTHGWADRERIQQLSDDVLRIRQGSLYPALHPERLTMTGIRDVVIPRGAPKARRR